MSSSFELFPLCVLLNLLLIWLIPFIQLSLENRQHFINFNLLGMFSIEWPLICSPCPFDHRNWIVCAHTHTRIRFHQMRVKKVTEFYNLSMRFTASTVEFFSHLFFFHSIRNKYTWMNLDNKKIELYNCVYILVAVDQRTTVFPSNDQMHQQQANGNVNMAHIYVYISTFYFVRSFFFLSLCF